MNVVVLGHSRIVRKRVLPALATLTARGVIGTTYVASRRAGDGVAFSGDAAYEEALLRVAPGLAYVSLPNALHGPWVANALGQGFHVVVDKPAFVSLTEAQRMVGLARSRHLVLAEATVWAFHPVRASIVAAFTEAGTAPTRVTAAFSFPPLAVDDFRYQHDLGGGSLFDVGPYAVSAGRVLFEDVPESVDCRVHTWTGSRPAVDTSFSLMARYPGARALVGHFGFTTEYRNQLSAFGPGAAVEVEQIFSSPPTLVNEVRIRMGDQPMTRPVRAADSFELFLEDVVRATVSSATHHADALLADAVSLHMSRVSAGIASDG